MSAFWASSLLLSSNVKLFLVRRPNLLQMEVKVSCAVFFSWHTTLCWTTSNLQRKQADDLLLVFSFTHSGGEEKSTGQTDPSPRSGQTPQNEEEKGLPGKVHRHGSWTLCQDFYHCSAFILFNKMHLYHSTFFMLIFPSGWCLHALCANFAHSTRRKWKPTLRAASIKTTLSSCQGNCPSPPLTS